MKEQREMKGNAFDFDDHGLSKTVLFSLINRYGVVLVEQEKALIASVFALDSRHKERLNYEMLDQTFEQV